MLYFTSELCFLSFESVKTMEKDGNQRQDLQLTA